MPLRLVAQDCRLPALQAARQDENYSALRDPACRQRPWARVKYVPLGAEDVWLSIGADLRERYEYIGNSDWGRDPADPGGYLLHRFLLHADLHLGRSFRVFAQLQSSLLSGRNGGARPVDVDKADLHQAFADIDLIGAGRSAITLRAGRQELSFGSQRLVSLRENPNVRRAFDGGQLLWQAGAWKASGFFTLPVKTQPTTFDDGREPGQRFWGIYATGPLRGTTLAADFYDLGLRHPGATFAAATARETRHSLGTRLWGVSRGADYNVEIVGQFGRFGSDAIRAWTVASDLGYTIEAWPGSPRFGLKADVTSGDRDGSDDRLETFNPLFPKGAYFGEASLIGPLNHVDLHPSVALQLTRQVGVAAEWDVFWRQRASDGLYRSSGTLQVQPGNGLSRSVGSQLSGTLQWQPDVHCTITADYAHFFVGRFLSESGLSADVDYFSFRFAYRI